jgi:GT2 family glycosyltransferase
VKVTALLVSHNGARWLPAVLTGLDSARARLDQVVAVDTGSTDDSRGLVAAALGVEVVAMPPQTTYADAVRAGLAAADPAQPDEWVWLLHDDARPGPGCLDTLLEAAQQAPAQLAALGPKIREWPSLKRLLEVGVTISGTGRRETGLERGEYDQGQHEQQHDVLAVNTAGMLVRREVLEELGLDPQLAVLGTDVDFGWRLARAGFSCQVVPDAVLFHVEAARRGVRASALVHHPHREERAGALYTLLANSPGGWLPLRAVRIVVGGVLRALGLLLVRAPGESADEVLAVADVLGHPGRIAAARRTRREQQRVPDEQVRHLLAPFWLPYRHGLDFLTDLWVALTATARDDLARRRAGLGRSPEPTWRRALGHPGTLVLLVLFLVSLVAGRHWYAGAPLHGGALLPAPDQVGHWWDLWSSRWHALGTGSDAPAPAYVLPLAVAATVLLGQPNLLVTLLFLFAVPLSFVGALRLFRRLVGRGWAALWAATGYAVLPVVTGAVGQGRLGTVVAAVLLPWCVGAALSMADAGTPTASWRATWRTALGLGLLTAFVPTAWLLALLLTAVLLLTRWGRDHGRQLAVVLALPLALVLPWLVGTDHAPGAWLVEAGRPATLPVDPGFLDLLLGRGGGPSAPAWIGSGLAVAALLSLVRGDTRRAVGRAWVVAALAAVLLAVVAQVGIDLPGVPSDFRAWSGFLVVVVQAAFLTAAAFAGHGVLALFSRASFSWRQPVAGLAVVGGLLTAVVGVGWWAGEGDDTLVGRGPLTRLPTYMTQLAEDSPTEAVLVLTGGHERGVQYRLLRSGAPRLGDDGVLALTAPDPRLSTLVESILAGSDPTAAEALAAYGVRYVFAPEPVDSAVIGGLDASAGFAAASAPEADTRAWRVEPPTSLDRLDHDPATWRPLWLLLQVLAVVAAVVLSLPERIVEGRRR